MNRPVPPAEQKLDASLANLICAYYWRAHEKGDHRPDGACQSCRRLVAADVHTLLGQMLAAAVVIGSDSVPETSVEVDSDDTPLPPFEIMEDVAERCAEICTEHLERVVQSDPRTFEAGPRESASTVPKALTDEMDVVFAPKEHGDGTPWVLLEPRRGTLPVLKDGEAFLGLTCREGASLGEVQRLTAEMNAKLRSISYTRYDRPSLRT